MQVPANMVAADMVEKVASLKKIPRVDGYSLFSVVCSDELERSLAPTEKVCAIPRFIRVLPFSWHILHCQPV